MGKDIKLKMNPAAESLHSRVFRCKDGICKKNICKARANKPSGLFAHVWNWALHLESMLAPGAYAWSWSPALYLETCLAPGLQACTWRPALHLDSKLAPGLHACTWRPALHLKSCLVLRVQPCTWNSDSRTTLTLVDLVTTENKTACALWPPQ